MIIMSSAISLSASEKGVSRAVWNSVISSMALVQSSRGFRTEDSTEDWEFRITGSGLQRGSAFHARYQTGDNRLEYH